MLYLLQPTLFPHPASSTDIMREPTSTLAFCHKPLGFVCLTQVNDCSWFLQLLLATSRHNFSCVCIRGKIVQAKHWRNAVLIFCCYYYQISLSLFYCSLSIFHGMKQISVKARWVLTKVRKDYVRLYQQLQHKLIALTKKLFGNDSQRGFSIHCAV